ncbi:hypothetical protein AURDEDRAFT_160978 [Auricularia subglabra TFB-10046 SS5]|nr:hypothetical protein AURDEDRAFT_160978 [Auricularia subglabra TFB-10046 SS5]
MAKMRYPCRRPNWIGVAPAREGPRTVTILYSNIYNVEMKFDVTIDGSYLQLDEISDLTLLPPDESCAQDYQILASRRATGPPRVWVPFRAGCPVYIGCYDVIPVRATKWTP